VILFEVLGAGMTVFECECDTPRTIDMYGVAGGIKASQRMKTVAWQVNFVGHCRLIQIIKPTRIRLCNLASIVDLPPRQRFASALFLKLLIM
jgi:hypothetical protein